MKQLVHSVALIALAVVFAAAPLLAEDPPRYSAWSAPVNLGPPVNTPYLEFPGTQSKDGLSLYFVMTEGVTLTATTPQDLWVSTRPSEDAPWGPPQRLDISKGLWTNPAGRLVSVLEGGPYVTIDGHTMYFTRTTRMPDANGVVPPGGLSIFTSRRHNKRHDFGPLGWQDPVLLPGPVNAAGSKGAPIVFEDDVTGVLTLYFVLAQDIYASTLQPDGIFGEPEPVAELNSPFSENSPSISRDGLEMYFISNRPGSAIHPPTEFGPGGNPSEDIWVSTRASTLDPWGEPVNLDMANANAGGLRINSDYHDDGSSLSFDGETLYFFSAFRRETPTGPDGNVGGPYFDIWKSTRTKLGSD